MRQIYIIVFFLLPIEMASQLFIRPYNNTDSFIYVEGQLLYVEKDINLSENISENPVASIVLRDEAQLLQGDLGLLNSGKGKLSIFQEGKAGAYTYNYWGLPVQNSGNSPLLSDIIYDPLDKTRSRKAILTQDLNGSSNPLKISQRWIYKLSGAEYSDWIPIGQNFQLKPGEGFTMKGVSGKNMEVFIHQVYNNPGENQRYDFRGKPNNGTISLPIQKDQILLLGNPYPSSLDLNIFLQKNTATTGIAYFWDSKSIESHYLTDYEGGYGAYSPAGGSNGYVPPAFVKYDSQGYISSENGSRGEHIARRFSPVAQGFLVEGSAAGEVIFKNEYRVFVKENQATSQFKSSVFEPEPARLRLNIKFGDEMVRQLLLFHHPDATNDVDHAMDAKNIAPGKSDAGWLINDLDYLINVKRLRMIDVLPLALELAKDYEVSLALEDVWNIDNDIFLLDNLTDEYHNLTDKEFSVNLKSGIYTDRFSITFSVKANEMIPPVTPAVLNEYTVYQNNTFNRLEVKSPLLETPQKIEIFDITGRKLREEKGSKGKFYYEFPTHNLSKGIYVVKIIPEKGPSVSKKVLISN